MKFALIGCSAKKMRVPAKARDLYQGPLFKFSVAWAEKQGLPWAVLSAKYGLVMPDEMIEPYDLSLRELTKDMRLAWGREVSAKLEKFSPETRFVFLAGELYFGAVSPFSGRVEEPLARMQIGERLSWLKKEGAA